MLRVLPEQVAPPVSGLRPRVARKVPVLQSDDQTVAVRGHLPAGGAVAMLAAPTGICIVSADRSGRRRVQRFTIREVLAIEEHRGARTSDLLLTTGTATITICGADQAQSWVFCREVRRFITAGTRAVES